MSNDLKFPLISIQLKELRLIPWSCTFRSGRKCSRACCFEVKRNFRLNDYLSCTIPLACKMLLCGNKALGNNISHIKF